MIQSFAVGEVSPELAHEIGQQFADEVLQGKYEYVLATHIDKGQDVYKRQAEARRQSRPETAKEIGCAGADEYLIYERKI